MEHRRASATSHPQKKNKNENKLKSINTLKNQTSTLYIHYIHS